MSDQQPQWQAMSFGHKIYGIFRLPGASQWRYLKDAKGEKRTFITAREAEKAARDRAMDILFPVTRGVVTEKTAADALGVEDWLRIKRADRKAAYTDHKAGRKPFQVLTGRAGR